MNAYWFTEYESIGVILCLKVRRISKISHVGLLTFAESLAKCIYYGIILHKKLGKRL